MTDRCSKGMTKPNGSCQTRKIAMCVQCSECDYYASKANGLASRTYLDKNPHCKICQKLGKRTAIKNKSDFPRGLWSCFQTLFVPSRCLSFVKCNRINNVNERGNCKKYYGLKRLNTSELKVNNLPVLPAMLDETEMSGVSVISD